MGCVLVGNFLGASLVEAALSWRQVHVNVHTVHVDDFDGALNFLALVRLFTPQKCSKVQLNNLFELLDRLREQKQLFDCLSVVLGALYGVVMHEINLKKNIMNK